MKKLLFIAIAAATMYSCNSGTSYNISGQLTPEMTGDSVYLLNADNSVIAAAAVDTSGQFTFTGEVETPSTALLAGENKKPFAMVFLEAGDIDVTPNTDETYSSKYIITGTVSNDQNVEVTAKLKEIISNVEAMGKNIPEATIDSIRASYYEVVRQAVVDNMDNLYGVNLFVTAEFANMELADAKILMDKFPAELQQTKPLVDLREKILVLEKTEIGQPYMEINLLGADGKEIALSSLVSEGKWILLDFWATWCPPCVKEIPYLLEAYEEYKDRGFTIYGVSLDRDPEAWKKYIVENKMVWSNVIRTEDSSATEDYAVSSIPTNYLISPEGIIVAKNLREEGVKEEIAKHIK